MPYGVPAVLEKWDPCPAFRGLRATLLTRARAMSTATATLATTTAAAAAAAAATNTASAATGAAVRVLLLWLLLLVVFLPSIPHREYTSRQAKIAEAS